MFNVPDYISKQMSKQLDVELSKVLCVIIISIYSDFVKTYSTYTYKAWYLFYVKNLKEKIINQIKKLMFTILLIKQINL